MKAPASHDTAPCALPGSPLDKAKAGLDLCVHCGFCLQACPTYVNDGEENDSPRGRIVLMRRILERDIAPDDPVASHIDRCLGCRGCETACPSGVPYGELLEATRATLAPIRGTHPVARLVLTIFRYEWLLRPVLASARVFRATGLPRVLAKVLPRRLAFPLAMLASTERSRIVRRLTRNANISSNDGGNLSRQTALLNGCIMSGLFAHVNADTKTVLAANGHSVCNAPGQVCCGALHAHAGDLEGARELARKNIIAFERSGAETIAVNAAGCAAMLKQYGHLLQEDSAWAERASEISSRTRDISEVLADAGPAHGMLPEPLRIAHDPPCHQMHAQRIVSQPVKVLQSIGNLELLALQDADQCCGAAGIYNLIEPDTSEAVLASKLARIDETGAQLIATGNPGCHMQIGAGLMLSGSKVQTVHPVELLAASYAGTAQ